MALFSGRQKVGLKLDVVRLPSTGMARTLAQPQQPETIRVIVFYGGDVSVLDLPQSGEG